MIVLDTSALVAFVLGARDARFVEQHLVESPFALAPHTIDAELVSALRRLVSTDQVAEARAVVALAHAASLRLVRFPLRALVPRVWELRQNVSPGDAFFVALAEVVGAPLVTTDRRLARAHGHHATVLSP